ncbi:MAG: TetR/AcrR family transcriptional regulator [Treponema sp.]|nr:TetR/AcrR family transcriptional regulator [Treponema sp.]
MRSNAKVSKEKIISAVLACSFEKGVGATSLAAISSRLGIKKASLYNHYNSREDMISDTVKYCGEVLSKTFFIPNNIEALASRYSAASVLRAIVNRWFKLNEKEPLLLINSFIESEKYFSDSVQEIAGQYRKKITEQTTRALKNLSDAKKIRELTDAQAEDFGTLLASAIHDYLDDYIARKKTEIRLKPYVGKDSLFGELVTESVNYSYAEKIVENFCLLLK